MASLAGERRPVAAERLRAPKLQTVQALRALAALMVAIAHAAEEAKYFFALEPVFDTAPLGKGVDIFFVISGFIIYYSSIKLSGTGWAGVKKFAYNRTTRVVPLYYLFTTLMIAVVIFIPSGVKEAIYDPFQIITSYLFIPYERYDGRIAPILSLGWTLNYEVFFYFIFGLFLWMGKRRGAFLTIATLLTLAIVGAFLPADAPAPLRAWTHNILVEFAMGIAIAMAYERYAKRLGRHPVIAFGTMLAGFVCLYVLNLDHPPIELPRFLSAGIPSAVMVGAAILLIPERTEERVPPLLIALGDSSYSLYLSHRFIQRPIQIMFRKAQVAEPFAGWIYLIAAVVAAVVFGHLIFRMFEQPLLRRFRRASSKGRAW